MAFTSLLSESTWSHSRVQLLASKQSPRTVTGSSLTVCWTSSRHRRTWWSVSEWWPPWACSWTRKHLWPSPPRSCVPAKRVCRGVCLSQKRGSAPREVRPRGVNIARLAGPGTLFGALLMDDPWQWLRASPPSLRDGHHLRT